MDTSDQTENAARVNHARRFSFGHAFGSNTIA